MKAKLGRVQKYLDRYACPEKAIASAIERDYDAVLVVPVYRESPEFIGNFRSACRSFKGRVLVIVVVNGSDPLDEGAWLENSAVLESLKGKGGEKIFQGPSAWLACWTDGSERLGDLLIVDRASPERCLPAGQGVGLARKIGCDIALALWARGCLTQPWLYCTDADACLPSGYFASSADLNTASAARVFEFEHVSGRQGPDVDAATSLYEVSLRYYVLSMAWAGSAYAYHSIGSALAVHADAYAAVRGFPLRLAGEDFHLLNKLAKVGAIQVETAGHLGGSVKLEARTSTRTVHGTGVAVAQLLAEPMGPRTLFYEPQLFALLKIWLEELSEFSRHGKVLNSRDRIRVFPHGVTLDHELDQLGAWGALERASAATSSETALRRRVHEWFDALKSLRLIHGLQGALFPPVAWREALHRSPWFTNSTPQPPAWQVAVQLATAERRLAPRRGPTFSMGAI